MVPAKTWCPALCRLAGSACAFVRCRAVGARVGVLAWEPDAEGLPFLNIDVGPSSVVALHADILSVAAGDSPLAPSVSAAGGQGVQVPFAITTEGLQLLGNPRLVP